MIDKTIAAISTPLGTGGIGIIRMSGPSAHQILTRLFVRSKTSKKPNAINPGEKCFSSHHVYYGFIIEPDSRIIIDEVLVIYMKGPKSFTREDVVEIHSHSGYVVLDRILSAVVDAGAILSGPGDFTKRAFINGRIDLSQAEAIIDLINAPCETAAKMASLQLAGGLRDVVEGIVKEISVLQARCEAAIEFSEEVENEALFFDAHGVINKSIIPQISTLVQRQKDTAIFREGLHLAIAGVPNVGKSSLLNKLVEKEAAIVSEVPGTTRDIVREYISINGIPIVICDTAGIHETKDPVECMGIKKARNQIESADLVLLVLEGTRDINDYEKRLLEELKNFRIIVVINKDDVAEESEIFKIQQKLSNSPYLRVSAKHGKNIDALKALIVKDLIEDTRFSGGGWVTPNLRHRKILEKAIQELNYFNAETNKQTALDFISERLKTVIHTLGDISGKPKQEALYEKIFSQFCVGK